MAAVEESAVPSGNNPKDIVRRHSSMSEWAEENKKEIPFRQKWFEWPFTVKDPHSGKCLSEATGWAMDAVARGPLNQAGAFVGNAILTLATREAIANELMGGTRTVRGWNPSSLLTFATAMVGVAAALFMPIAGAVVDHTRHRKTVGVATAVIVLIITGCQLMIKNVDLWFGVLILEALGGFFLIVHITAVLAYLPDLTNQESGVARYTSRFNVSQYLVQTCYVAIILIASAIKDIEVDQSFPWLPAPLVSFLRENKPQVIGMLNAVDARVGRNVFVAMVGLGLSLAIGTIFLGYSWSFLFRKRGALSEVPPGSNILTAGFNQVITTVPTIWRKYRALKWLMLSLLWSPEQSAGVVLSIGLTWVTLFLKLDADQVGYVSLILLAAVIPGSLFSMYCCKWFNPLNSYRMAQFFLAVGIGISVGGIPSDEYNKRIYGFAVLWGFPFGWLYASQRVLFVTLIPKGQTTEIMGLFTFFGQILGWLPPVIFTIMSEKGVDIRWGVGLLSFFYLFAMVNTFMMGSYQAAKDIVDDEFEAKMSAKEEAEALEEAETKEGSLVREEAPRGTEGAIEPEDANDHQDQFADNELEDMEEMDA